MLFSNADLERIVAGEVDLAFRSWKRPMHVVGGRQRTQAGVIEFTAIDRVEVDLITESEAARAGTDLAHLRRFLDRKPGEVYRIGVRFAGSDERATLREQPPDEAEITEIVARLRGMDRRSKHGPWTRQHLLLIAEHPAELAETLATSIGREKKPFKADVRRLKELGLTESLRVGYRLSPRGRVVLERLAADT